VIFNRDRFVSFEIEIVNDIEERQRDGRFVGDFAVQIFVSGRHCKQDAPGLRTPQRDGFS
jgi:hypothetical protein